MSTEVVAGAGRFRSGSRVFSDQWRALVCRAGEAGQGVGMPQDSGGWSHVRRARATRFEGGSSDVQLREAISAAVEAHGGSWLERDGAVSHSFVRMEERPRSVLAVVDVHCRDRSRRVVAKAVAGGVEPTASSRPRLVERTAPADRLAAEFSALTRIAEFPPDDRFFAIEPLGFSTDPAVLVMEWSEGSPLTKSLADATVAGGERLMTSIGAWLARFHTLDIGQAIAYEHRVDLPRLFGEFGAWRGTSGRRGAIGRLQRIASTRVLDDLGDVPLGPLHGDMAPRNFLVDSSGRVGGIDVSLRWRAPILHDLAAFWLSLRVGRLRVRDPRAHKADRWFESFLRGYGLEARLRPSLDLYRALLLLDRAAAASGAARRTAESVLLRVEAGRLVPDVRVD